MKVKIEELIINPEYEKLVFPLSGVDFNNLEQSILKEGVLPEYPIIINPQKVILDGHHRVKICKKYGIGEVDFLVKSFENDLDEKEFVVANVLTRRHLTEAQKAEIAFLLKGIEDEKARRRQLSGLKQYNVQNSTSVVPTLEQREYEETEEEYEDRLVLTEVERAEAVLELFEIEKERAHKRQKTVKKDDTVKEKGGRVLEILAKKVGLSKGTLYKVLKIKEEAEEDPEIKEVWEKVKKGEKNKGKRLTIDGIFKYITRRKKEEKKREEYHASNHTIGHIVLGDSTILLDKIADASYDLLLTDPPYITEIDDYEGFLKKWLPKAIKKVKDTGRIYIFCSSHPDELLAYLKVFKDSDLNGFTLANLLVWHYQNNIGPAPKYTFKRGWQGIFYLYGKNAEPWDEPLTKDLFDHFNYSMPDGRQEIKYHSYQKPEPLIKQLIVLSSKQNDRIMDLFAGSGEIGLTASKLNRYSLSIEIKEDKVEICKQRGLIEYAP